jgi:hypothetical protein
VILATSAGRPGRLFLRAFLPCVDRAEVANALPAAAVYRLGDPNVTGAEREAVHALLRSQAL